MANPAVIIFSTENTNAICIPSKNDVNINIGVANNAICIPDPIAISKLKLTLFFIAHKIAEIFSPILPKIGINIIPIKLCDILKFCITLLASFITFSDKKYMAKLIQIILIKRFMNYGEYWK